MSNLAFQFYTCQTIRKLPSQVFTLISKVILIILEAIFVTNNIKNTLGMQFMS